MGTVGRFESGQGVSIPEIKSENGGQGFFYSFVRHQVNEMKNRIDHPIEFLESMIENFSVDLAHRADAFILTTQLITLVKVSDSGGIRSWIKNNSDDPERHGSAFFMIYQFAVDYLKKLEAMANQRVQRDAGSADAPDA